MFDEEFEDVEYEDEHDLVRYFYLYFICKVSHYFLNIQ